MRHWKGDSFRYGLRDPFDRARVSRNYEFIIMHFIQSPNGKASWERARDSAHFIRVDIIQFGKFEFCN